MPRSASGIYSLPIAAFIPGTGVVASKFNANFLDIGSVLTFSVATTGVSSMTGPIKAANGSVTDPSYTFAADLDSGRYLVAVNQFADVVNNTQVVTYNPAGITVPSLSATLGMTINGVGVAPFAAGTKKLFFNTAAPTGWTKDVTLDNASIKLVSGTVGADGGTLDFSTVFSNVNVLDVTQLPNISITNTNPTHTHTAGLTTAGVTGLGGITTVDSGGAFNLSLVATGVTEAIDNTARGGVVQQPLLFAVKYAEAIRASKN